MNNKAFSLIELAIVLIIIGLIVAGVTGGQVLIDKSRIYGARMLTKGSVVPTIEDLVLWLEPTLEGSFLDTNDNEINTDSTAIKTWRNRAGWGGYLPSFSQSNASYRPLYIEEGAAKLPTVRFDGTDDCLRLEKLLMAPVNEDYSIFAVFQVSNLDNFMVFFGQFPDDTGTYGGWCSHYLYYHNSYNAFYLGQYSGPGTPPAPLITPAVNTPYVFSATYDFDGNSIARINGANEDTEVSIVNTNTATFLISTIGCRIFKTNISGPLNGNISEIIIYNRVLNSEERDSVEDYLKQKYKI